MSLSAVLVLREAKVAISDPETAHRAHRARVPASQTKLPTASPLRADSPRQAVRRVQVATASHVVARQPAVNAVVVAVSSCRIILT